MHLSSYLMLVGAAVLVTHLSGTDSYAIARSSSKVEDHDSKETSADNERMDAARNQTSSVEDSTEDEDAVVEDSSEEQDNIVKRSAQFSRNSDEFDNFSLEINNRPVGAVPTATNAGRLPLVPLSFRNPVLVRQRDDDDDISIEVRNRAVATPVIQQVNSTQTVASGRLPVPISLRNQILRQSDDDFDDVSLEIVNRDRVVLPTPVQRQIVPTQTATTSRLPVPIGFRTQLVRESDGDVSLEIVRDINVAPNHQAVPSQTSNQFPNVRTPVFRQSDDRDDISVEVFGSILNQNGQVPTAVRPVQTSAIRPIQQENNRQQPIQTFSQVNNVPPPRPVTALPQVQPTPIIAVTPVAAIRPTVASSDPFPLVPMSFRNPIVVRQRDDDFDDDISIEIRDRVAVSPVVQPVVSTQTVTASSGRLPVPIGLRNSILRPSLEIDDVSAEIRDRNVFTPTTTQQVNQPQANGQIRAPVAPANNRPEFIITQDFDGDVSVELVSRAESQQNADNQSVQQGFSISPVRPLVPPRQPEAAGGFVQTGNEGQQQQFNVFDDYSLEDNRDDDDNDYDFFLEDQLDNIEGFRFLADDFFSQPPDEGFPSARSVKNHRKITKKDHDDTQDSITIHLEPVSLDESDFHVPAESDDWFLVKQYMDHDYSSEELEGELAKAYFWQPVKDSKKLKTDEDKMAELKPTRS